MGHRSYWELRVKMLLSFFFFSFFFYLSELVETYLLERSRVTQLGKGETNFHIFAQVADGRKFKLLGADKFVHGSWSETKQGLEAFGIDPALIKRTVEGILWLGEIEFKKAGDGAQIENSSYLEKAATSLGLAQHGLSNCLILEELDVRKGGTAIVKKLSVASARSKRNALAKLIYSNLFHWVVASINTSLACQPGTTSIGVLDIFGFEVFEENVFEQLLINYANEQLHHLFVDATLRSEQDRYSKEGIDFTFVDFADNSGTVVSSIQGILRSLDDATQLGKKKKKAGCFLSFMFYFFFFSQTSRLCRDQDRNPSAWDEKSLWWIILRVRCRTRIPTCGSRPTWM
jgi:myosin heavy subunit